MFEFTKVFYNWQGLALMLESGADSPVDFVPRLVAFETNVRSYAV